MAELSKEEMLDLTQKVNDLFASVNVDDVSAESSRKFEELPEGYFLCEVDDGKLTKSKSSGNPMASFTFTVVEDGVDVIINEKTGLPQLVNLQKTAKQKIFKHYVFKGEQDVRKFVSDMLKFEGDKAGEPLLPKEAFTTADTIDAAIEVLAGHRVYIQVTKSVDELNNSSTWYNLISWKRAKDLGLKVN